MTEHAVVIAGGGPTGLMLAGELALAGVDVAIVERRDEPGPRRLRAGGLHARTIEVLDQRGIADRFLAEGQMAQVAGFAGTSARHQRFPDPAPLWARALAEPYRAHPRRLGRGTRGAVPRGREVTGVAQDDSGVDVALPMDSSLCGRAIWSAATADAARSARRPASAFPGWDATTSNLIAEVEMAEEPEWGVRRDALGLHSIGRVDYEIRDGKVVFADRGRCG